MNQPQPPASQSNRETTIEGVPRVGTAPKMSVENPSRLGRLIYLVTFLVVAVSTLFLLGLTLCAKLGVHLPLSWLTSGINFAGAFGQPVPVMVDTAHWVAPAVRTALFYAQVVLVLRRLFFMVKTLSISPPASYRSGAAKLIQYGWASVVAGIAYGLFALLVSAVPFGFVWFIFLGSNLAILYGLIWVEVLSFRA